MRNTTADVIIAEARDTIANPENWCKGVPYRNKVGDPCEEYEKHQCCLVGALISAINKRNLHGTHVEGEAFAYVAAAIRYVLPDSEMYTGVADYNDNPRRTHEEVLSTMNRALRLAESREAV